MENQPERRVNPNDALAVLSLIGPDYTMEDAMRLLFPEQAECIYDPSRWPFGLPQE